MARRAYILKETYFMKTGSPQKLQEVNTRSLFNIIDFLIFQERKDSKSLE